MPCREAYNAFVKESPNGVTAYECFEAGYRFCLHRKDRIDADNSGVPYAAIINNMNQQLGKSFKITPTTKMHIHARWKEGFRLEDFERVVRIKNQQWKDNPDMNLYLRPETLFGTKMNSYANEPDNKAKCTTPDWM